MQTAVKNRQLPAGSDSPRLDPPRPRDEKRWIQALETSWQEPCGRDLLLPTNPYGAPMGQVLTPFGIPRVTCGSFYTRGTSDSGLGGPTCWVSRTRVCPAEELRGFLLVVNTVLNDSFTPPEYRRQGVAGLLAEWGSREADGLDVEAYVEATSLGVGIFYKRCGFVTVDYLQSEILSETRLTRVGNVWPKNLQAGRVAIMGRPSGGRYVEGETVIPWEGAPRID